MKHLLRIVRLGLLAAVLTIALTVTWRLTAASTLELFRGLAEPSRIVEDWTLDQLVTDLGSALLLVATSSLIVVVGLAAAAALAVDRAPTMAAACRRLTPARCRRLVALLLGLGLASPVTVAGVATADEHRPPCRVVCRTARPALEGLRLPDLPVTPTRGPARNAVPQRVVVHAGDSLWRIAERRCGDAGSDAQIAALTHRLYALNRATIGDDPDLIFPGMTLLAPEGRP